MALVRNSGGKGLVDLQEMDSMYHRVHRELKLYRCKSLADVQPTEVTDEARVSFFQAFGISPDEQCSMEDQLDRWEFMINGQEVLAKEWDVRRWECSPDFRPELPARRE
jgi:hypothetical protein